MGGEETRVFFAWVESMIAYIVGPVIPGPYIYAHEDSITLEWSIKDYRVSARIYHADKTGYIVGRIPFSGERTLRDVDVNNADEWETVLKSFFGEHFGEIEGEGL